MHTPIQAVIFDCDGTLVDSEPAGLAGIADAAATLGVRLDNAADLLALKGRRMADCLALVQQRLGRALPDGFEGTVRAAMAEQFQRRVMPMPGALALLQGLRARGLPYCIASNGPRDKMLLTLSLTGLLPLCEDRLFSAYEVGSFKPDPALVRHAAQAMGVAPERCALVEDSAPGAQAGLAAGMWVQVLRSPEPLPAALLAQVRLIEHLGELPALWFGSPAG